MLNILILLCFVGGVLIQSLDGGSCPKISSEELDHGRIAGHWYDVLRSGSVSDEETKCLQLNISLPDADKFRITFSAKSKVDNEYTSIKADAQLTGNYLKTKSHLPVLGLFPKDVYIIKTDYDNFLAIYGCESNGSTSAPFGWFKVRNLNYTFDTNQAYQDILLEKGIDSLPMEAIDTTNC